MKKKQNHKRHPEAPEMKMCTPINSGMNAIPGEEVRANVLQQLKHFVTEETQASTPLVVQSILSEPHFQLPSL
jgi:hypothetical protein